MRWSWILLALAMGGCITGVVDDTSGEERLQCANPLRGSRYAMCGRLSTAGLDLTTVGTRRVTGSVDSTHQRVTSRYSLRGGTFHAYR
jgi:hypothetical protein